MSTDANRSWVAACRRLAAALGVLVLLAGLFPAHAGAHAALTGFDRAPASPVEPAHDAETTVRRSVPEGAESAVADPTGVRRAEPARGEADRGAAPDAVPCHAACHCACKIAVLPDAAVRRTSSLARPAAFSAAPPHAARPGLLAPPSEPPRT